MCRSLSLIALPSWNSALYDFTIVRPVTIYFGYPISLSTFLLSVCRSQGIKTKTANMRINSYQWVKNLLSRVFSDPVIFVMDTTSVFILALWFCGYERRCRCRDGWSSSFRSISLFSRLHAIELFFTNKSNVVKMAFRKHNILTFISHMMSIVVSKWQLTLISETSSLC